MGDAARTTRLNSAILKVSGLFGGLQVANIICSVVRAKLVAVWIGAAGMGLFGIFNTAIEMLTSLSLFGLRESAVRSVAQTRKEKINETVRVVRRCALVLGLAGMMLTLALSGVLSRLSFDSDSYTWAFMVLSAVVLMSVLNAGESAVLQGLRRYRKLAYCSMVGSIGGLAVSIPMFYFWRINSIVPSIIAYSLITWVALGLYREKLEPGGEELSVRRTVELGKKMLSLGFYLTVTGFVANAISYAMMAWLNNYAGTDAAGYYQAGFTLVNRYVGLVFTAISIEYYPRLSSVEGSARRIGTFVGNQMFMLLSLLVPVVIVFICCSELIVTILYTSDFHVMVPFIILAATGTVLRGISWSMAFVILAKGDGRTFLVTEVLSGIISIILNIVCYIRWGFMGLGFAYIGWYLCYTLIVGVVYFNRYRLDINRAVLPFAVYSFAICGFAAWIGLNFSVYLTLPLAAIAGVVSLRVLKRKVRK